MKVNVVKKIKEIDWEQTIAVRHEVLWPNKPPKFCHINDDNEGWHFGCYINEELVSVASVYPNENKARLRKFATREIFQGKGLGSELLNHIISTLKERNIETFWCDARESAIGFYQRFGMKEEGERFYKSEVPYFKMSMKLTE